MPETREKKVDKEFFLFLYENSIVQENKKNSAIYSLTKILNWKTWQMHCATTSGNCLDCLFICLLNPINACKDLQDQSPTGMYELLNHRSK